MESNGGLLLSRLTTSARFRRGGLGIFAECRSGSGVWPGVGLPLSSGANGGLKAVVGVEVDAVGGL